ncbi:MAG: right-handed parallel beta-helix repeat-containing protein [Ilumatobacter sp.]|uniref:right-handed parallel beta-helix repeat-containing protein n=1 Tax=Ilumatobacter sp. TaxID=1967498 RepID=UPI00260C5442|nr:right-handed parallel beta-helix repeat-containing protein [Ilumatobacter sp.]MDJ0770149.1 right-handed parallel beta-helix repeat-containing protein [Ilumatobacter sp.]
MNHRFVAVLIAASLAAACGSNDPANDTAGVDDDAAGADDGATVVTDPPDTDPPDTDPPATDPPASDPPATDPPGTTAAPAGDGVHRVPDDFDSIQAAVDAAQPGDLVLISPGTYNEAVDVVTDEITIRGTDRDGVVLDGRLELDNAIRILGADGVAVENLTTTNYTNNGVFWIASTGYRASYITTYRTGDYGIYAFDSVQGQIEHSHTIGSRDAGVYIGQCYPCDAVITDVVSSHNGLGYSGTNSGGNLLIVNSVWHNNRVGIVPNSGSYELCYPERDTTIIGNLVYDNNQSDTSAIDVALLAQGNGILIAGGIRNRIERNRVDDHFRTGIGLVPFLEENANDDLPTRDEWELTCDESRNLEFVVPDDSLLWDSFENQVTLNVVTNSGEADLAVASVGSDISTFGNCFGGNDFSTSAPLDVENLAPCEGEGIDGDWAAGDLEVARWIGEQASLPPEVPWQEAPLPELGPHENMPDPENAPARPATDVPFPVDLDAITVPELP